MTQRKQAYAGLIDKAGNKACSLLDARLVYEDLLAARLGCDLVTKVADPTKGLLRSLRLS